MLKERHHSGLASSWKSALGRGHGPKLLGATGKLPEGATVELWGTANGLLVDVPAVEAAGLPWFPAQPAGLDEEGPEARPPPAGAVETAVPLETLPEAVTGRVPGAAASREGASRSSRSVPVSPASAGAMSVLAGLVSAHFRSLESGRRLAQALGAPASPPVNAGVPAWQRVPAKDAALMAAAARR